MNGFDYGNGTHLAKGYENLMYRLDSLAVTGPSRRPVAGPQLRLRSCGEIRVITRELPSGAEPHVFEYDPMDRLSSWTKPGRSQELTYDANGNRQSLADDARSRTTPTIRWPGTSSRAARVRRAWCTTPIWSATSPAGARRASCMTSTTGWARWRTGAFRRRVHLQH